MRKLLLALACMLFMTGLVLAAEYTLVSYKDKVATLKDKDDKEVTGKITDDTKVYFLKGEDKTDGKVDFLDKAFSNEKAVGKKYELTIKDGVITEATLKRGKKKN
jgi:hypothetical protein